MKHNRILQGDYVVSFCVPERSPAPHNNPALIGGNQTNVEKVSRSFYEPRPSSSGAVSQIEVSWNRHPGTECDRRMQGRSAACAP